MTRYIAVKQDGTVPNRGDILHTFRDARWTYQSTTHPRKVFVTSKSNPNGPDSWPNKTSMEFYASVFNLAIWDTRYNEWSFTPGWPDEDIAFAEDKLRNGVLR